MLLVVVDLSYQLLFVAMEFEMHLHNNGYADAEMIGSVTEKAMIAYLLSSGPDDERNVEGRTKALRESLRNLDSTVIQVVATQ